MGNNKHRTTNIYDPVGALSLYALWEVGPRVIVQYFLPTIECVAQTFLVIAPQPPPLGGSTNHPSVFGIATQVYKTLAGELHPQYYDTGSTQREITSHKLVSHNYPISKTHSRVEYYSSSTGLVGRDLDRYYLRQSRTLLPLGHRAHSRLLHRGLSRRPHGAQSKLSRSSKHDTALDENYAEIAAGQHTLDDKNVNGQETDKPILTRLWK